VAVAATGHGPHDVGSQNLPAFASRTEPGRLDDRISEVVVVLPGHFPTAETNPQGHRAFPIPVVPLDALLHGHGTGQRG